MCTSTRRAHRPEAVCVINQYPECILVFQGSDLPQLTLGARHAKYPFGNQQNRTSAHTGQFGSPYQLPLTAFEIVVLVYKTLPHVEANAVYDTGMRFSVVNNDVVAIYKGVDNGYHALIAVVEQKSIFFANITCQILLQFFVMDTIAGHHAGSHGVRHAEIGSRLSIHRPYFGMIGQAQVIVEAPYQMFFPVEQHPGSNFTFQLRKRKIAM